MMAWHCYYASFIVFDTAISMIVIIIVIVIGIEFLQSCDTENANAIYILVS